MTISTQRHEVKDGETLLPSKDLYTIKDNAVYNGEPTKENQTKTEGAPSTEDRTMLTKTKDKLQSVVFVDVKSTGGSRLPESKTKKTAKLSLVDVAAGKLKKTLVPNLPPLLQVATEVFDKEGINALKAVELAKEVGLKYLCNKTGEIKVRTGISLEDSIQGGILGIWGLINRDELCLAIEEGELTSTKNPIKILEKIVKYKEEPIDLRNLNKTTSKLVPSSLGKSGAKLTSNVAASAVSMISNIANNSLFGAITDPSGYGSVLPPPSNVHDFIFILNNSSNEDFSSNFQTEIDKMTYHEISEFEKEPYIEALESELLSMQSNPDWKVSGTPTYDKFNNFLKAKGDLITTPMINKDRVHYNSKYEYHKDYLGRFFHGVLNTDLSSLPSTGLTEGERIIFDWLSEVKTTLSSDPDFYTRDNGTGSYDDYDFSSLLPEFEPSITVQETVDGIKTYTLTNTVDNDGYPIYDLDAEDVISSVVYPRDQAAIDMIASADLMLPTYLINEMDVTTCLSMGLYDRG